MISIAKRKSITASIKVMPTESATVGLKATKNGIEKQFHIARHITKRSHRTRKECDDRIIKNPALF